MLFAPAGFSQIKTGKWLMPDGSIIHRPNDSTQIETKGDRTDTTKIIWVSKFQYQLVKYGLTVYVKKIVVVTGDYSGFVTDGKNEKYFKAKKL